MFGSLVGSLVGGIGSGIAGLFGGGKGGSSPGLDLSGIAKANEDQSLKSSLQGSSVPSNAPVDPTSISGSQSQSWVRDKLSEFGNHLVDTVGSQAVSSGVQSIFGKKPKSATELGRANREYLQSAFPELNPWELSGASATAPGTATGEQDNSMRMLDKQLANNKDIAKMNNDTQVEVAKLQAETSRANTADQVFAPNELVQIQKIKLDQEVQSIVAQRDLTFEQTKNAVQALIESQARVRGIHASTEQTEALTNKVAHEIRNIDADTGKKTYGGGHISSDAYAVGNMISDALDGFGAKFKQWTGGIGSSVKP